MTAQKTEPNVTAYRTPRKNVTPQSSVAAEVGECD